MGFTSQIQKSVDNAFKAIGDLATNVLLSRKTSSGFDFNTLGANVSAATTTTIPGIVSYKKRKDSADTKMLVTFKSTDVSNFGDFDEMTINGTVYIPERPFVNNGFTTEVTVVRGA